MLVCLLVWVYLTFVCLTLIRSRFSYNHTYQHAYLCVCVFIYMLFFCLFVWVYLTAGCLLLCFSSVQVALFEQQPVVGPAIGHFRRAFIASVSVRVSRGWGLRYFCLSASVDLLLDIYLPVFFVLLVCVCFVVSRRAPADKQTQLRD
jgi:hypothetical protein